jgi:dynein light chain Tctex-type 1
MKPLYYYQITDTQCWLLVTCVIMQNNGAGFHTASSCYWESCDGSYIHKFEGKNLYCITSVYSVAL